MVKKVTRCSCGDPSRGRKGSETLLSHPPDFDLKVSFLPRASVTIKMLIIRELSEWSDPLSSSLSYVCLSIKRDGGCDVDLARLTSVSEWCRILNILCQPSHPVVQYDVVSNSMVSPYLLMCQVG